MKRPPVALLAGLLTLALCCSGVASPAAAAEFICGDANHDGKIRSGDALLALRTAVGTAVCSLALCDYTGDGKIASSDALAVLRKAVGQAVLAKCPALPGPLLQWDNGLWGETAWD